MIQIHAIEEVMMVRRLIVAVAVAFGCLTATPHGASRPDFSGTWLLVDPSESGVLGASFVAAQDATTLTLELPSERLESRDGDWVKTTNPPRREIYNLTGQQTRATYEPPASVATADSKQILWAYRAASSSRASWNGDELVIVTHHMNRVNSPSSTPTEFESETTVRLTLALDAGHLVAESAVISDPPPWDSPTPLEFPPVRQSVYRRAR